MSAAASGIIESHRIGDILNTFHKSFESICAEQGISVSEAVQHVASKGRNIARVRLLPTSAGAKGLVPDLIREFRPRRGAVRVGAQWLYDILSKTGATPLGV
jgi:hypothetical protein